MRMTLNFRCLYLLIFILASEFPCTLTQFGNPPGAEDFPFGPPTKDQKQSGTKPFSPQPPSNGSSPFFEMSGKFTFSFSFETFMKSPPGWLTEHNLGLFVFSSLNLFIKKGLFFFDDKNRDTEPFSYKPPDKIFNGTNLSISPEGEPYENLLTIFENVISLSPHRAHPWYFKRDAAGICPYAMLGDIIAYVHFTDCTGEAAPALFLTFWIQQRIVIIRLRILIGYLYADGVMMISSHMANIAAVHHALITKYPEYALKGFLRMSRHNTDGYPAIFICEGNIHALKLFGIFGGVPEEFLIKVKMDKEGRMDVKDLVTKIKIAKEEGRLPFMIYTTMGSTTLGAVDPISEIADIAEEHELWFHIDATHGGACMFSNDFREKWPGIERSNSLTFEFSTMLGTPYSASFLMIRLEGILDSVWSLEKMYSFTSTHIMTEFYNNPKFTDAGKVFLQWMVRGNRGYRQHVDYAFRLTRYLRKQMKSRGNYQLLTSESDTPVVAFRVIPPIDLTGDDDVKEMDKFTRMIQMRLLVEGFIYITMTRVRPTEPKHLIMSLANSILTEPDLDYVLDKIDCHVKNILQKKLVNQLAPCLNAPWKRVGKASPLAAGVDGYAPYANSIMPDHHLPFFVGLFQLVVNVDLGIESNPFKKEENKPKKALDLGLSEVGLKTDDILPYIAEMSRFIKNIGTLSPTSFKMIDKTVVVGVMAEFVLTITAPGMDTYESSPPFMKIKEEIETLIRTRVGYPNGKGDGTVIPPSGVMDPIFVIKLAKFNYQKKKKGKETNPRLVFFVSSEAHYSWKKAASSVGLGMESCKYVPADEGTGKMSPDALDEAIQTSKEAGEVPFLVVASLGTDILGAVDPFDDILQVCKEYELWCHIDGRIGGPVIFSNTERKKLKGIEKSDSFSFGPSKFYKTGATDPFSVLVTRKEGILKEMLNKNKPNDDDDDGMSLNSGRTAAEFKFWIVLKSEGIAATATRIEQILKTTQKGIKKMKDNGAFNLIQDEFELNHICFLYLPKKYRTETDLDILDLVQIQVAKVLKQNKVWGVYYTNTSTFEGGKYGFLKIEVIVPEELNLFDLIANIHKFGDNVIVPKNMTREKDEKNHFSANRAEFDGKVYGEKTVKKTSTKTTTTTKGKESEEEVIYEETETTVVVKKTSKKQKGADEKADDEQKANESDDGKSPKKSTAKGEAPQPSNDGKKKPAAKKVATNGTYESWSQAASNFGNFG